MKLALSVTSKYKPVIFILLLSLLSACGGSNNSSDRADDASNSTLSPQAALGEQIFKDQNLSASGKMSCASCHNPDHAHAQANTLAVQFGGARLDVAGFRAVPSLRYLNLTPAFYFSKEGTPTGGFTHDGRADTLSIQAARPFLAPHEMANKDKAEVITKLLSRPYASAFRAVYGTNIFSNAEDAFDRVLFSLQQYQLEDPEFHPYDSKYDQFLAGKISLSDAEMRGLALFNNPQKGNCAACHTSSKAKDGSSPLFTDFTFDNLGVPRNYAIPATLDANYFDLGLCGPDRLDLSDRVDLCGKFKVPTLRNVATRKVFFHNGRFDNLHDVLGFYVRRDTNPEEWYPIAANGQVLQFNDLPSAYASNVNTKEVPYNRKRGMSAALSKEEIEDVIQFLGTLNDGYRAK